MLYTAKRCCNPCSMLLDLDVQYDASSSCVAMDQLFNWSPCLPTTPGSPLPTDSRRSHSAESPKRNIRRATSSKTAACHPFTEIRLSKAPGLVKAYLQIKINLF